MRRLLGRLEGAIDELEAQNEAGEESAIGHLPERLQDRKALRERVRETVHRLADRDGQKQINLTDQDARMMKTRQGYAVAYNAQAMVSTVAAAEGKAPGMLITAVDVVNDISDRRQLGAMMEKAEETLGQRTEMTLADAGYHSGNNLQECALRGQRVVMPESQDRALQSPYHKDRFTYDEASDSYRCPEGRLLRFTRTKRTRNTAMRLYRASGAVCRACPAFGVCTKDKRHGRALEIGSHDAALRRHRAWMSTEEAKGAYKQRMQLVEPVFGIIKEQQQAHRFLLRGLTNVSAEWSLLATAFNLRTLWKDTASRSYLDKALGSRGRILGLSGASDGNRGHTQPPASINAAPPSASPTKPTPHVKHNLHLKQTPRACPVPSPPHLLHHSRRTPYRSNSASLDTRTRS